jgi:predicted KAP-like P-loop ATPase
MTSTIRVSADAAKTDPDTDDALGCAPFAKRIADVVVRMPASSGYVITVQGAWGSGKSTALNFARTYIERHNAAALPEKDRVEVVEFRPWLISGHEDLVAAFFKVLKEKISPDDVDGRRLGTLLARMSKGAVGPAVGLAAGLAKAVNPTGGIGSAALGDVANRGVTALLDAWLKEPSLQSTYEQLREELSKSGRRFLVVIDDIDRLEPEEIRVVMQLVKSVGSLPNVIYLLSYDRHIVSVALGDVDRTQGPTALSA